MSFTPVYLIALIAAVILPTLGTALAPVVYADEVFNSVTIVNRPSIYINCSFRNIVIVKLVNISDTNVLESLEEVRFEGGCRFSAPLMVTGAPSTWVGPNPPPNAHLFVLDSKIRSIHFDGKFQSKVSIVIRNNNFVPANFSEVHSTTSIVRAAIEFLSTFETRSCSEIFITNNTFRFTPAVPIAGTASAIYINAIYVDRHQSGKPFPALPITGTPAPMTLLVDNNTFKMGARDDYDDLPVAVIFAVFNRSISLGTACAFQFSSNHVLGHGLLEWPSITMTLATSIEFSGNTFIAAAPPTSYTSVANVTLRPPFVVTMINLGTMTPYDGYIGVKGNNIISRTTAALPTMTPHNLHVNGLQMDIPTPAGNILNYKLDISGNYISITNNTGYLWFSPSAIQTGGLGLVMSNYIECVGMEVRGNASIFLPGTWDPTVLMRGCSMVFLKDFNLNSHVNMESLVALNAGIARFENVFFRSKRVTLAVFKCNVTDVDTGLAQAFVFYAADMKLSFETDILNFNRNVHVGLRAMNVALTPRPSVSIQFSDFVSPAFLWVSVIQGSILDSDGTKYPLLRVTNTSALPLSSKFWCTVSWNNFSVTSYGPTFDFPNISASSQGIDYMFSDCPSPDAFAVYTVVMQHYFNYYFTDSTGVQAMLETCGTSTPTMTNTLTNTPALSSTHTQSASLAMSMTFLSITRPSRTETAPHSGTPTTSLTPTILLTSTKSLLATSSNQTTPTNTLVLTLTSSSPHTPSNTHTESISVEMSGTKNISHTSSLLSTNTHNVSISAEMSGTKNISATVSVSKSATVNWCNAINKKIPSKQSCDFMKVISLERGGSTLESGVLMACDNATNTRSHPHVTIPHSGWSSLQPIVITIALMGADGRGMRPEMHGTLQQQEGTTMTGVFPSPWSLVKSTSLAKYPTSSFPLSSWLTGSPTLYTPADGIAPITSASYTSGGATTLTSVGSNTSFVSTASTTNVSPTVAVLKVVITPKVHDESSDATTVYVFTPTVFNCPVGYPLALTFTLGKKIPTISPEAITAVDVASSVASLTTVNPTTAINANRLASLRRQVTCEKLDTEAPLDTLSNLLGMSFGPSIGGYYRGAIVSGLVVVCIGLALMGALLVLVKGIRSVTHANKADSSWARSACESGIPSLLVMPVAIVLQPSYTAAMVLLQVPQGPWDYLLAISAGLPFAAYLFHVWYVTYLRFRGRILWFYTIPEKPLDVNSKPGVVMKVLMFLFVPRGDWMTVMRRKEVVKASTNPLPVLLREGENPPKTAAGDFTDDDDDLGPADVAHPRGVDGGDDDARRAEIVHELIELEDNTPDALWIRGYIHYFSDYHIAWFNAFELSSAFFMGALEGIITDYIWVCRVRSALILAVFLFIFVFPIFTGLALIRTNQFLITLINGAALFAAFLLVLNSYDEDSMYENIIAICSFAGMICGLIKATIDVISVIFESKEALSSVIRHLRAARRAIINVAHGGSAFQDVNKPMSGDEEGGEECEEPMLASTTSKMCAIEMVDQRESILQSHIKAGGDGIDTTDSDADASTSNSSTLESVDGEAPAPVAYNLTALAHIPSVAKLLHSLGYDISNQKVGAHDADAQHVVSQIVQLVALFDNDESALEEALSLVNLSTSMKSLNSKTNLSTSTPTPVVHEDSKNRGTHHRHHSPAAPDNNYSRRTSLFSDVSSVLSHADDSEQLHSDLPMLNDDSPASYENIVFGSDQQSQASSSHPQHHHQHRHSIHQLSFTAEQLALQQANLGTDAPFAVVAPISGFDSQTSDISTPPLKLILPTRRQQDILPQVKIGAIYCCEEATYFPTLLPSHRDDVAAGLSVIAVTRDGIFIGSRRQYARFLSIPSISTIYVGGEKPVRNGGPTRAVRMVLQCRGAEQAQSGDDYDTLISFTSIDAARRVASTIVSLFRSIYPSLGSGRHRREDIAVVPFQGGLNSIVDHRTPFDLHVRDLDVPPHPTASTVIQSLPLSPIYAPFLEDERARMLRESALRSFYRAVHIDLELLRKLERMGADAMLRHNISVQGDDDDDEKYL